MSFKVNDIVEIIKILPDWDIYKDRDKIFNKPYKITRISGFLHIMIIDGKTIGLREERLKLYTSKQQLLFSFMRDI